MHLEGSGSYLRSLLPQFIKHKNKSLGTRDGPIPKLGMVCLEGWVTVYEELSLEGWTER